ncbi:MAG TPA: M48 family metallopeptidase [Acidobacteriaceae bacterium]|nr:M48 family metallopeptidase [Acidobacteriaceae bacterium]
MKKAIALSHWSVALTFGGTAWMIVALDVLVQMRAGAALLRVAQRVSAKAWVQGLVVAPLWMLILTALGVPVALLGHHVSLAYGISVERWAAWWGDFGKSTALTVALGTLVLGVLYALMRHAPRRWWLWFWVFTMPVVVLGAFLEPLVIDPMFNRFEPLAKSDPALVEQLERVAARGGLTIPADRIYLMDASSKVTGPNAYVTGIGASKRIVVWDTTLKVETPDEILFTYGHEQGHYVLHHIPKGIAFAGVLILAFYWIGFRLLRWLVHGHGGHGCGNQWGIDGVESWASVGLVLLLMTVLSFVAEPLGNAFSRHLEHQADVYGQEVIHGLVPDAQAAAVSSFCVDARVWLDNPDPDRFVVFWTYTHPSTEQRAEFAAHYDPWLPGREPRYFKKN